MTPGGTSILATSNWQPYDFNLTNLTDIDRQARVFMYFPDRPDVQYGRDVWVPAQSTVNSWLLAGPAPRGGDLHMLLIDRTGGQDERVRPKTDEIIRSRGLNFRKRVPFTAVMLDDDPPEESSFGKLPRPETRSDEASRFVLTFRHARGLTAQTSPINARSVPPSAVTFDIVDHVVLASNRIAHDPAGMLALRHWLARGGNVWVMLDMVDLDAVAPLLGEALDFQVVDRVGLTTTKIDAHVVGTVPWQALVQQHERPVDMVRVLLPADETPRHTINGWPVHFTRSVGRGKVLFTTAGGRAWHRPRTASDPKSPYPNFHDLPVPTQPLIEFAEELHPAETDDPLKTDSLTPLLTEEIGFAVMNRGSVGLIFAATLLAALALGFLLRRTRRPELLGWLGPAAAVAAAALFVVMGESSRRAVPPTVAVVQFVEGVAGHNEASLRGLMAVYRPDSGPATVAARQDGFFELDMAGIEGQTRRFIMTDADTWHWDNLSLPAGVRLAPFHATIPTKEPIVAHARFGPDGIEGKLSAGPFQGLADALLSAPDHRNLAVHLQPDGTFRARSQDILAPQQVLASAVLSDRQQRRQEVYRKLLARSTIGSPETREFLYAWGRPVDLNFTLSSETDSDGAVRGSALIRVPVQWQRSAPGSQVRIPGPLVRYERVMGQLLARPTFESTSSTEMHLRFQAPASALPLKVERAVLLAKIEAPNRRVTIAGKAEDKWVELHKVDTPLDVIRVEIDDARLLTLDARGGLHLNVSLSQPLRKAAETGSRTAPGAEQWTIEYLEVEVTGTCR